MVKILEETDRVSQDILELIKDMNDPNIKNLHSVDNYKTSDNCPNVVFDYKHDMRVMISVLPDESIKIDAPVNVKSKFSRLISKLISNNYPSYTII